MSSHSITLSQLREVCNLPDCSSCSDNGCNVQLDGMPERVVFRPDEEDDQNPRADCVIFFPENSASRPRTISLESPEDISPQFVAIVELKNTISDPNRIKQQLEGALDVAIGLLEECADPNWGIKCFCLVAKNRTNTYHKSILQIRIRKTINGTPKIFRIIPVNSGESIREAMQWDRVQDAMVPL